VKEASKQKFSKAIKVGKQVKNSYSKIKIFTMQDYKIGAKTAKLLFKPFS